MTLRRVILLILVLAILVAGVWFVRQADQQDRQNMRDLYTLVEPLQQEKEALLVEKDELEAEYEELLRDPSTVEIFFREMDKTLYTDVYPLMRDRGLTGVLGINLSQYPSSMAPLTKDQYIRLLKDGWGSCLIFQEGYSLDTWLTYMQSWMDRDELELPTAIYFPDKTYDAETMDEVLINYGIDTVVLSADNGHSSTVTQIEELWFTGAMPWNYTGINSDLELLSYTEGANLAFTVSFKDLWDAYEKDSFVKLLDSLEEVLVVQNLLEMEAIVTPSPTPSDVGTPQPEDLIEPQLKVTSFQEARAAHLEATEGKDLLLREKESREAALDRQIDALNAQIDEIYDTWSKKSSSSLLSGLLG